MPANNPLRATLSASPLRELIAKWRKEADDSGGYDDYEAGRMRALEQCADELEALVVAQVSD